MYRGMGFASLNYIIFIGYLKMGGRDGGVRGNPLNPLLIRQGFLLNGNGYFF